MKTDKSTNDLRVAIVCDWLLGIGGAERVVLELHKMFPSAPIYTSQYNPKKIDWFKGADVRTTWLQKLPTALKKFLPVLRASAFSHLDLSNYDLVISASGAEAKAVKTGPDTMHIAYCFAPTHYYWSRYEAYIKNPGFGPFNWLARLGLKAFVGPMRRWDYKAAQRPDYIIGISTHIQNEIKKYYDREAQVIHPPVDVERFGQYKNNKTTRSGFVITGRQTHYKRFDLAVAACTKLGLSLRVIGNGPEHKALQKIAGPAVTFVTDTSDADIPAYIQSAEAFIFPGLDDFGIAPVEAMAAGTPIIAYKAGGALDYVIPGTTGEFFEEQTVESLSKVLQAFKPETYKEAEIQEAAHTFAPERFHDKIYRLVRDNMV